MGTVGGIAVEHVRRGSGGVRYASGGNGDGCKYCISLGEQVSDLGTNEVSMSSTVALYVLIGCGDRFCNLIHATFLPLVGGLGSANL